MLPLEKLRHRKAILKEIDRMTDRNSSSLEREDTVEWRRLAAIAEENLRVRRNPK